MIVILNAKFCFSGRFNDFHVQLYISDKIMVKLGQIESKCLSMRIKIDPKWARNLLTPLEWRQ